jgi:hypothetical protein
MVAFGVYVANERAIPDPGVRGEADAGPVSGVVEAAKRVHDERIGVGRVFHLFRLPETMEQRLFDAIQDPCKEFDEVVVSPEAARATLEGIVGTKVEAKSGPAMLGTADKLDDAEWIAEAAALYSAAFNADGQCFPYFTGSR